jgi:flagellar basal-body rod protein FlgG
MAITALQAAATGMKAQDTKLDVLANNLANVNTVGFKRSRVNFEDLLYQIKREPGIPNAEDEPIPHGIQVGVGVGIAGTQLDFEQGTVDRTERPLDLLIDGDGFFRVRTIQDGSEVIGYTRYGVFTRNSEGNLVLANSDGSIVDPPITIPEDTVRISVGTNGEVSVLQQGSENLTIVGQLELSRFVNPEGLLQIGQNLYQESDASGPPLEGNPQEDGLGSIRQGSLEMSNVDPVRELIQLILTQRAFELNSQSIQSADQSLQVIANLRRF